MEALVGTVWVVGGMPGDQKFVNEYLEKYGYTGRTFLSGEECLENLVHAPKHPDMIMILNDGQIDAERIKYVISHIEPDVVIVHLSITQILAIKQKEYSNESQQVASIQGMVNPALKRLTAEMIKLCELED